MRSTTLLVFVLVGCTQATSAGDLFGSDTTEVSIRRTGGLAPTPGVGSTCAPMDNRYVLEVSTRILSWQFCESPASDGVYSLVASNKALSAADYKELAAALRGLTTVEAQCAGDIVDEIAFSTPSAQSTFDHANCLGNEAAVFAVLDAVAK